MKKFYFLKGLFIILCIVSCFVLLAGCRYVENSTVPFRMVLEVSLDDKFSKDITVTTSAGHLNDIGFEEESYSIIIDISEPTTREGIGARVPHEYVITLYGQNIESGTYIRVVTNDVWSEIDKIYDKDGNEIPFEQGPSVNDYSFTLP